MKTKCDQSRLSKPNTAYLLPMIITKSLNKIQKAAI